jgi:type I restriction enzyme, S subunit
LTFQEIIGRVVGHASGGAQQHINKEIIRETKIVLPPNPIARRFKRLVEPMFECLSVLLFVNRNLRRTRDLLLPKLMSVGATPLGTASTDAEAMFSV